MDWTAIHRAGRGSRRSRAATWQFLEGGRVMEEQGDNSFPLTVAQRGLWMTQKITPGAILNIAEAVEIFGPINPEIFRRALHQVVAAGGELRGWVVQPDCQPQPAL